MNQELMLGTAKVDITPAEPVMLAGFAERNMKGPCEGVSHSIYARILYFHHRNHQGHVTSSLLISADFLWWGSERVPDLKRRIHEKWGVEEDAVILHATHSHSGPQMSEQFSSYLGSPDISYIEQVENQVLTGIGNALTNMEPVQAERGNGECHIGINRRLLKGDECVMAPNLQGPIDHEVTVIRYRPLANDSKTKALLVHYACHPVITRENRISSEFTGVAMERLEEQLGVDAVCAYMQGACGDINPYKDGKFYFGTDRQVVQMGETLADAVLRILSRSMRSLSPKPLKAIRKEVQLPLQALPTLEQLKRNSTVSNEIGEWSRMLLDSPDRRQSSLGFEMTYITLADELSLLSMNGEIVTDYGLFIKKLTRGQAMPLGYTNGMIGYIPTAKQIHEGGYESVSSIPFFHMPASFQPLIEEQIYDAIRGIVT